jgi:iron complex outermembrane receptor protein
MTQLNQVIDSIKSLYAFFLEEAEEMEIIILLLEEQERSKTIQQELNLLLEKNWEKSKHETRHIRMMLNESTDYSNSKHQATSGNSSIRIKRLDGEYTQILKMVSGFLEPSGVRITANTAIRFKTVEILKGLLLLYLVVVTVRFSKSYFSKYHRTELDSLNGTSALGLDVNGFYSQRFKKLV